MQGRSGRIIGGSAVVLLVAAVLGLAAGVGDSSRPAPAPDEVAGRVFERPPASTLSSSPAVVEGATAVPPTPGQTPLVADRDGPGRATVATVKPSATTSTTRRFGSTTTTPVKGRPAAGTQVTEKSDSSGEFTYRDSAMSDRRSTAAADTGFVRFDAEGTVVDGHGRVTFKIANHSGGSIGFPDGVAVKIAITRPDGSVKVYEAKDPAIRELAANGSLEGKVDFPLIDDGTYKYAGEILVEYR